MTNRYYVLVGLDVPGHFTKEASPEQEEQAARRLVQSVLRDALTERDIPATITDAVALSPQTIDLIILALREDEQKREARWQAQKETLDKKLAELREVVASFVAKREGTP